MAGSYNGNPDNVTPGNAVAITTVQDGVDDVAAASVNVPDETEADWLAFLKQGSTSPFGDGSDGDQTLDGTVGAPAWATKAGSVYTATRDVFVRNLTVTGAGTKLVMAGYRLYVSGTLTTASSGIIHNNGADAAGQTAGAGGAQGTLLGGTAGGNGGAGGGGAGANGTNLAAATQGGRGGNGGAGVGAGGTSGTISALSATAAAQGRAYGPAMLGFLPLVGNPGTINTAAGGTGAGGGGGNAGGADTGGGGGGGAGAMAIACRALNLASAADLQCKGGKGGNGAGAGPGYGGGGGGGGDLRVYYGRDKGGNVASITAANNCTGGAVGTGGGGPVAGNNGTALTCPLFG